jgi:hypothetical protein
MQIALDWIREQQRSKRGGPGPVSRLSLIHAITEDSRNATIGRAFHGGFIPRRRQVQPYLDRSESDSGAKIPAVPHQVESENHSSIDSGHVSRLRTTDGLLKYDAAITGTFGLTQPLCHMVWRKYGYRAGVFGVRSITNIRH